MKTKLQVKIKKLQQNHSKSKLSKQQRYIRNLAARTLAVIEEIKEETFTKELITKKLKLKSSHNVAQALTILYRRKKIKRVYVGCKNALREKPACSLYAKIELEASPQSAISMLRKNRDLATSEKKLIIQVIQKLRNYNSNEE